MSAGSGPNRRSDPLSTLLTPAPRLDHDHDLASATQIAGLNEKTAFTAASTIKVAIMLNLFMNVPKLNDRQTAALKKMIVESDNLKAERNTASSIVCS